MGVVVSAKRVMRLMARHELVPVSRSARRYSSYRGEIGEAPVIHSDRGCHYQWPEWIRICKGRGLTRSMSAKGCSPDNAAAEGFFGRMKTESVYPERWEERTRDEVLVLIDDYIRWYNHERLKQSLGWMSPVIPSEPRNGCVIISKKTSATLVCFYVAFYSKVFSHT